MLTKHVCSSMKEDLPEEILQGVYPLDIAHLGVAHQIIDDDRGMAGVIHHHPAEIHMMEPGIIPLEDTHHQDADPRIEGEIHRLDEDIHLKEGGETPQIGGDILQTEELAPQIEETLQTEEGIHQIGERLHQIEEADLQLGEIILLDGLLPLGNHPHLKKLIPQIRRAGTHRKGLRLI